MVGPGPALRTGDPDRKVGWGSGPSGADQRLVRDPDVVAGAARARLSPVRPAWAAPSPVRGRRRHRAKDARARWRAGCRLGGVVAEGHVVARGGLASFQPAMAVRLPPRPAVGELPVAGELPSVGQPRRRCAHARVLNAGVTTVRRGGCRRTPGATA